ncbi:MAG TPA: hypothetical protein VGI73_13695 [Solirubrobacterales bacterium]|jgi:hypothetical protein
MYTLKILALALVIGALSALAASSASANYTIVPSAGEKAGGNLIGSQANAPNQLKLETDVGAVRCSTVKLEGELPNNTEATLTVRPFFSTCFLAGVKATVSSPSCRFRFETPVTPTEAEPSLHAGVRILCSLGTSILIHDSVGLNCSISIGQQGPLNKVSFVNNAGGTVTATFEVTGITYTDNGSCPSTEEKEETSVTGTYTGPVTFSGFSSSGTAAKELMVT